MGDSVLEVIKNLILQPHLVWERVFSLRTLRYLALLVTPLLWGLTPQHLTPLLGATPILVLNILSDKPAQRDLIHQYSLPVLPFLIVAVIASLAAGQGWLRTKKAIVVWALVAFVILAKYGFFWSRYLRTIDTWEATREAIAQIQSPGPVLTTHSIAPHLTHRAVIHFVDDISGLPKDISLYDYILLNVRHPDGTRNPKFAANFVKLLQNNHLFILRYQRDQVYLFVKNSLQK